MAGMPSVHPKQLAIVICALALTACSFPLAPSAPVPSAVSPPTPASVDVEVICSSCLVPGLPSEGHTVFLDRKSGEIWAYGDDALVGNGAPIYVGTMEALGKPIVKKKPAKSTPAPVSAGDAPPEGGGGAGRPSAQAPPPVAAPPPP